MTSHAQLPPEYRQPLVREMLPDQIVYLDVESFLCDANTNQPYVYGSEAITREELRPKKIIGRIALMRVYGEEQGKLVDGYVADMRYLRTNTVIELDGYSDGMPEGDVEEETEYLNDMQDRIYLVGLLTREVKSHKIADDNELYTGDEIARPFVDHLKQEVDLKNQQLSHKAKKPKSAKPGTPLKKTFLQRILHRQASN